MRIAAFLLLLVPLAVSGDAGQTFGRWQLGDGEDGARLYQDALTAIRNEDYSGEVTPRLVFQCAADGVSVSIDWRRFISSLSTEVGFKADDGKFAWLKWKMDSSEKVTLGPSSEDNAKLIDLVAGAGRITVEVSPYSEGPVTAQFEAAGFGDGLAALRATCH